MLKRTMASAMLAGGLLIGPGLATATQAAVALPKLETAQHSKSGVIKVRRGHFNTFGATGPFRGGWSGGGRNFGGRHFGGRRHFHGGFGGGWNNGWGRRHYGYRRHYGPRIYFGTGYGYRNCGYLRRRAVVTGSRYWWRRYQQCRNGW